ncbi:MAG: CotH kinase family protein [Opitutaceae bacterium]|nr:CotH kinase family protein [Opitutaceae bacterium]
MKPLAANSFRSILALATLAFGGAAVQAEPVISEFMAANSATLADEDGAYSDWLELHNPDTGPVDLTGWYLTDSASNKKKWQLPAVTLPAGAYLVIFASNKNRRDPAARLHTNFALNADGEYLALLKPDGVTVASEYAPAYPSQNDDVSFGLPATASGFGTPAYLRAATPGRANEGPAAAGLTETVAFSHAAGPFRHAFSLQLSGASGDQKIRYVLVTAATAHAAPAPTAASPEYTGPIFVDQSTRVRAAVFSADGTAHGPVTEAYFARLGASISSFSSQLPVVVLDNLGAGPLAKDEIDHPSWLFSYPARANNGPTFSAAPELVSPLLTSVRGSSSADFPKKGYNIKFTDPAGNEREQALLDLSAHEKWALVAPWSFDLTYINNAFVYALSNQMGRWAPRTRLVEVFFNANGGDIDAADYAGIYVVTDRIEIARERVALKEMSKSDVAGSALTGGYIVKIDLKDPDEVGWVTRRNIPEQGYNSVVLVAPKADEIAPAQLTYIQDYLQGMEDALAADTATGFAQRTYLDFIDRESWVDHHLLNVFVCKPDAFTRSAYFTKNCNGKLKAGPVWDFDRAINCHWDARSQRYDVWFGLGTPDYWRTGWWGMIAADPEFMQDWIDRWQTLRTGPLENNNLSAIADGYAAQIGEDAVRRDAARWPDSVNPWGSYAAQIDQMKRWLHNRTRWIDEQFVAAPRLSAAGGNVTFTPPVGAKLAYTLDGSDPRSLGGGLAPNALLSSTPITVATSANLHARSYREDLKNVFPGSPWSSPVATESASPLTPRARLINLSSRAVVGGGDDALIAGVIVADTATKRYLSRAVGPGLAAFGATQLLPDPQLSIFSSNRVELYRNSGWEAGREASLIPGFGSTVGAFPLAPGSKDAALADPIGIGSYTVQVTSATGQTGVALAELYELDANGRTVNLSTRARVRAGDGVLIGGFVVVGPAYKRMLIRAVGPTLAAFGVGNALKDPVLTVYAAQAVVATNDRWTIGENVTAVTAATTKAGAFNLAANSEDAALLITLPPGPYTVEVKGKDGGEGVALLEIYEVP